MPDPTGIVCAFIASIAPVDTFWSVDEGDVVTLGSRTATHGNLTINVRRLVWRKSGWAQIVWQNGNALTLWDALDGNKQVYLAWASSVVKTDISNSGAKRTWSDQWQIPTAFGARPNSFSGSDFLFLIADSGQSNETVLAYLDSDLGTKMVDPDPDPDPDLDPDPDPEPVFPNVEGMVFGRDLTVKITKTDDSVLDLTARVGALRFSTGLNITDGRMPLFAGSRGVLTLEIDEVDSVLRTYDSVLIELMSRTFFRAKIEDYDRTEFQVLLQLVGIGSVDNNKPIDLNITPSLTSQQTPIGKLPEGAGVSVAENSQAPWWDINAQGAPNAEDTERFESDYTVLTFLREFAAFGSLAVFEDIQSESAAYRAFPMPTSARDKRTTTIGIRNVLADHLDISDTSRWQADAQSLVLTDSPFKKKNDSWNSDDTHSDDGIGRSGGSGASDKRKLMERYGVSFPRNADSYVIVGWKNFFHGDRELEHTFFGFISVGSISAKQEQSGRNDPHSATGKISTDRRTIIVFTNDDGDFGRVRFLVNATYWSSEDTAEREIVDFYHDKDGEVSEKQFLPNSDIALHDSEAQRQAIQDRLALWNAWDQPTAKIRLLVNDSNIAFLRTGDIVNATFSLFERVALITRVGYYIDRAGPLLMDFDMIGFKDIPLSGAADTPSPLWITLDGQPLTLNRYPVEVPNA